MLRAWAHSSARPARCQLPAFQGLSLRKLNPAPQATSGLQVKILIIRKQQFIHSPALFLAPSLPDHQACIAS